MPAARREHGAKRHTMRQPTEPEPGGAASAGMPEEMSVRLLALDAMPTRRAGGYMHAMLSV